MIAVLILLPPSEGKAPAGDGPAVDLATLAFPQLAKTRKTLMAELARAVAPGLVVDLRSWMYAGMWKVPASAAERTATVRVLHERIVDGVPKRSVVSHFNKAKKGRLARALLVGDVAVDTPKELAE